MLRIRTRDVGVDLHALLPEIALRTALMDTSSSKMIDHFVFSVRTMNVFARGALTNSSPRGNPYKPNVALLLFHLGILAFETS